MELTVQDGISIQVSAEELSRALQKAVETVLRDQVEKAVQRLCIAEVGVERYEQEKAAYQVLDGRYYMERIASREAHALVRQAFQDECLAQLSREQLSTYLRGLADAVDAGGEK